jgi:hypothetical protein
MACKHPVFLEFVSAQPHTKSITLKVDQLYQCLCAENPEHVANPEVVQAFDNVFKLFSNMLSNHQTTLYGKRHAWMWEVEPAESTSGQVHVAYVDLYRTMEKYYPRHSRVQRLISTMTPQMEGEDDEAFADRCDVYLRTHTHMRWTKAFNSIWRLIVRGTNERLDMEIATKRITKEETANMDKRVLERMRAHANEIDQRHNDYLVKAFVNRAQHDSNFATSMFQKLFKNGKGMNIEALVVCVCQDPEFVSKCKEHKLDFGPPSAVVVK